jgi:sugar phosphate isomerase/epimerase
MRGIKLALNVFPILGRLGLIVSLVLLLGNVTHAAETSARLPFFAFGNGVGGKLVEPERQAALLAKLGFDGISYSGTQNLANRIAVFERHGLRIFNLYVGVTLTIDGPVFEPGLEEALQMIEGRDIALWLFVKGEADDGQAQAVEAVSRVARLAGEVGVDVAIYPHFGFYVSTLAEAVRLVVEVDLPNVGMTFNLCHYLKSEDPDDLASALKEAVPYLRFVSISGADAGETKDMGWERLIQSLDRGTYDVARVMRLLTALGYRGPVGLQCYRVPGEPEDHLSRSISSWKSWGL